METTQEILVSNSSNSSSNSRQPSERLALAVKECALGFRKLQDSIEDALSIGRSEGYADKEIGVMIRQEMLANNYSIRTVQRYLPASAKRSGGYDNAKRNDNLSFQSQPKQIQPSDYKSIDLNKCSKEYLISVIHYLEQQQQQQIVKSVKHDVKAITNSSGRNHTNNRTHAANKPLPEDKIQQIRDMHAKGMSSRQIFAKTGIARTTIARYW